LSLNRRALTPLVGLLLLAASALPVHAQPNDSEKKAAAQALFDEARKLTSDDKFAEACPKFTESVRLDPTMGTKFYLADCLEHIGRLASAWAYYVEVADGARAAGLKDRETFARERVAAILPKLGRLTVVVSESTRGVAGLSVKRDGFAVSDALWGTALPVDPGAHVISATATGKAPWETRVEVKEPGQTLTVEVPALTDAATPEPVPTSTVTEPPPPPPPPSGSSGQRIAGFAVGAVGLVGLGVGVAFGVSAIGKKSDSNAAGHCDSRNLCDDIGLALRKEGINAATLSTVGFIVGGAALVGGVVLLITAPRSPSQGATAAHRVKGTAFEPSLRIGPAGVAATVRW
jgi:hypothetical protein